MFFFIVFELIVYTLEIIFSAIRVLREYTPKEILFPIDAIFNNYKDLHFCLGDIIMFFVLKKKNTEKSRVHDCENLSFFVLCPFAFILYKCFGAKAIFNMFLFIFFALGHIIMLCNIRLRYLAQIKHVVILCLLMFTYCL
ncbi:hypothetical protein QTP88_022560 [Uroleucon formosanum]